MSDPLLRQSFLDELATSVRDGGFLRLTLGKPRSDDPSLRNLYVRPVILRGEAQLSFLWRHERQDLTKNHPPEAALAELGALIGETFHSAHLFTTRRTSQLEYNKKGEPRLTFGPAQVETASTEHDRAKVRLLPDASQAWLEKLGVTTATGAVKTGMADKHRQLHKFVEILSHLWKEQPAHAPATHLREIEGLTSPLRIADMGCGKGYLTFATYDYFNLIAQQPAVVTGIEARPELVQACNQLARTAGREHLRFVAGTIESTPLREIDVLIALHACDTATDDAIAQGIAADARLIVTAPCCQKELRAQLRPADVLAPALRHGIFQERHAEFATDALRALLLEWAGYDTKVFEFISTEHTAKNVMIAATKRPGATRTESAAAKVRELAAFYGVKTQALARHLQFSF